MAMLMSLQMAVTYGYIHTGDQRLKNSKSLQSPVFKVLMYTWILCPLRVYGPPQFPNSQSLSRY